jgi:hypothetical protein
LTGVVSVAASSLAILALLAFAVSLVAFLYRTSRLRSSEGWAVAPGFSWTSSAAEYTICFCLYPAQSYKVG